MGLSTCLHVLKQLASEITSRVVTVAVLVTALLVYVELWIVDDF